MSDINKWLGTGRLTRDVDLRYTPNGTAVLDMSVCCNRVWSKDGDRREEPCFVDVTLWGKQAESLCEYLKKGVFVLVEGRLQLDTWETEEGVKRSKLKVVADKVNLGPKTSSSKPKQEKVEENVEEDTPF